MVAVADGVLFALAATSCTWPGRGRGRRRLCAGPPRPSHHPGGSLWRGVSLRFLTVRYGSLMVRGWSIWGDVSDGMATYGSLMVHSLRFTYGSLTVQFLACHFDFGQDFQILTSPPGRPPPACTPARACQSAPSRPPPACTPARARRAAPRPSVHAATSREQPRLLPGPALGPIWAPRLIIAH